MWSSQRRSSQKNGNRWITIVLNSCILSRKTVADITHWFGHHTFGHHTFRNHIMCDVLISHIWSSHIWSSHIWSSKIDKWKSFRLFVFIQENYGEHGKGIELSQETVLDITECVISDITISVTTKCVMTFQMSDDFSNVWCLVHTVFRLRIKPLYK